MKLHSIALAAAAIVASAPAFAVPAVNVDGGTTVRMYISGATALRAVVAGIVLNDICGGTAANTSTTLYNVAESGSGFAFTGNFWGITCNVTAAGGALVGLAANTPIAVFKSDAGGSAQGVFPVFFQDQRPFVQPVPLSGCTQVTLDRAYTNCPGTRNAPPNVGISDVEPGLFKGFNVPKDPLDLDDDIYPADGLTPLQQTQLKITPVVQTVFGVAVNTLLYNEMFAKQGLATKFSSAGVLCTTASTDENCIPSIGYAEARSLFAGTESNWRVLARTTDPLLNSQLNICRRVDGSGTQAAANVHLLSFPCNGNALSPADWTFSSSAAPEAMSASLSTTESGVSIANYLIANMGGGTGTGPMPTNSTFVFEGPGTGDVVSCLNRANNALGYAIGHVSKENVPATTGTIGLWKHVRLEGANPLRDNAKAGKYDYTVESTVQHQIAAFNLLSASEKALINGFTAQIAKPNALAKLSSANQNGVAALPTSYAGAFGTGTANEITFGSRVTRSGNSCNPLTAVK